MIAILKFLVPRLSDTALFDISEAIDVELVRRMEFVAAAHASAKRQPPAIHPIEDVPDQRQRRTAA